jgi:glycosyltransferase involved in cell wall biosynthesis
MTSIQRARIALLIDSLAMGGAERLLTIYLKHFDTTRFEPRVCALQIRDNNPLKTDIEQLGIPVDLVPVKHLRDPLGIPHLISYLRKQQIDLLHTQLEFSDTLGTTAARFVGIPAVSTLHTFDDPPKGTSTYWRLKLRWGILKHFSHRIIAVSEGTRQHHMRVGKLPANKVVTLYNGIDLSRFADFSKNGNGVSRQSLNIPENAPLLTTVAVLRQPKGIQYMIEALPTILASVPETRYLVVGSGDHEHALKELTKTHGVEDRVIFTGSRDDIPDLLALSDVFVLPTLGEALPTVLAEAMAAQKPIVVSNVGGVPEMVEDGRNGLLVAPANPEQLSAACLQLLQQHDQAQAMARAGREIVEQRFNIEVQGQRLGDLYQDILQEQGKRI